jgi:hypothetical protein
MNSYFFKITDEEKTNILNKHKDLYNGYLSVQEKVKPTRLSTYDDISDKKGFTLTNADLVKEGRERACEQCGGSMSEGECMECGAINENWNTDDIDTETNMDFIEMEEMYDDGEMEEMYDDEETIYELEYDEYDMSSMTETFVREAKKLILSETKNSKTPIKKKINENNNLNNGVNEKLIEIKNFMHRIAKY